MKRIFQIIVFLLFLSAELKAQQTLQWAKSFNGYGFGWTTTTDYLGNVYTVGNFTGTVDFDPGPSVYNVTATGINDMFFTKVDANGNLVAFRRTEGAPGSSITPSSVKIDLNGDFTMCGTFSGIIDFDPNFTSYNIQEIGASDCFILKWDAGLNFLWVKQIGANNNFEYASSLDVDVMGNVYVTGTHYGNIDLDPGSGVFMANSLGFKDAYVLKLDNMGNYQWGCNFGSTLDDGGVAICLDGYGSVWSTGYFADLIDFDPSFTTHIVSPGNGYGAYISKLDVNGNYLDAKAFTPLVGGSMNPFGIIADASGNIYSTGYLIGTVDFDPSFSSFNLTSVGSNDVYVSKISNNCNLIWAKSFGGTNLDIGKALFLDNNNNLYVTGNYRGSVDFDPDPGSHILSAVGGDDVFINKLDVNGNFLCASSIGGTGNESSNSIAMDSEQSIIIAGYFQSVTDFDPGIGTYTIIPSGSNETFVSKYKQNFYGAPLSYTICSGATQVLTGQGVATYSWSPPQGLNTTNGSTVIASPTINTTFTVNGTNGCINTTTLISISVLPKPNLITQSGPVNLICDPDSVLLHSTSTNTNVLFQWRKQTSSTYSNQPYYAKVSGPYYSKVTDLNNGCADSSLVIVTNKKIYPNAKITSHNYISALISLDTITCYTPTINVVGASDTAGVNINWKSIPSNLAYSNPIAVTSLGNYKLFVKRNDNNCIDSSVIVLMNQNTFLPIVNTTTTNLTMNCSVYNATLNAAFSPTTCNVNWVDPSMATMVNPSVVNQVGKYKFTATDPQNGCSKTDSVNVIQTNELLLKSSNDTTVCKNSQVNLTAVAIGTTTGVTYSWSTSQNGNIISVSPNSTSTLVVYANSSSGCFGTDTVIVNIPTDIQDSIITIRSCSNNTLGTIVVFAKGGIAPYKYSITNGTTYSTNNTFQNVPFGLYQVVIKDSIGCKRQANVNLNSNSSLPVPKFLASTKNFKTDTIVFVDVSIPKPDSVHWMLPPIASIIGGNMFSPIVLFNDTGSFNVTMQSYYGTCIINATKLVRFAPYDSLYANQFNANGIKTFSLYPNPNNGQFTVYVEFYKKQDASVIIYDVNSYKQYQQNFSDVQSFTLPIDVSYLLNGAYMLRVLGEYDAKNRSFIISK